MASGLLLRFVLLTLAGGAAVYIFRVLRCRIVLRRRLKDRVFHLEQCLTYYNGIVSAVRDEATCHVTSMPKEAVKALYEIHVLLVGGNFLLKEATSTLTKNRSHLFHSALLRIDSIVTPPDPKNRAMLRKSGPQPWEQQIQALLKIAAKGADESRAHIFSAYEFQPVKKRSAVVRESVRVKLVQPLRLQSWDAPEERADVSNSSYTGDTRKSALREVTTASKKR